MAERRDIHKSWEPVLARHREQVATGEHREAVRESVSAEIEAARKQVAAASAGADDTPAVAASGEEVTEHVRQLSALQEPDQVAYLGKIALEEGVAKAVAIAEKSGSPYVISALHDLLVNELAQELEVRHKSV